MYFDVDSDFLNGYVSFNYLLTKIDMSDEVDDKEIKNYLKEIDSILYKMQKRLDIIAPNYWDSYLDEINKNIIPILKKIE